MTDQGRRAAVGFHSGELAVKRQAGVQAQASRLARMVGPGELHAGMAAFVAAATFAAITARDRTGRLWTSPLLGPPGFLQAASPTTLQISTTVPTADPLHEVPDGQPAGVIVIDFTSRRRVRINGVLTYAGADSLIVDVDQAYGNCPRYIQQRRLHLDAPPEHERSQLFRGDALRPEDFRLVQTTDTVFLGTTHPDSGNDASHRGGAAGFVRATPDCLWWPDYPGNNMFNSFGNLSVDPTAALLFVDFVTGTVLQMSGAAAVQWDIPAVGGDDGRTGRRVQFVPSR